MNDCGAKSKLSAPLIYLSKTGNYSYLALSGLMAMDILTELYRTLPPQAVITDSESKRPYECDGLSAYRQLPGVVVLPDTVEQVQAILKLCHRYKTPVVPRGAGTGLSGGALPLAQGVLLSLTKFNRILALDPIN